MTVPVALKELDKVEVLRQADGLYRLDHAVTATQKDILAAFNLNVNDVKKEAKRLENELKGLAAQSEGVVFMARGKRDINIRIKQQENKILKITREFEEAKEQYENLLEEKKEADKKMLYAAFEKSKRSVDEVLDYLKGKADI